MQIGEVIRQYRKEKNMTQEEMARRLGVTAPAVNKWENGNSLPDIMLLAPIARLLDITPDTLLSFHEELTTDEINRFIQEMDSKFQEESYDDVFQWAKHKLEQYPDCWQLIWQTALVLDVQRITQKIPDPAQYDDYLYSCYSMVLDNGDEEVRQSAADSLFGFHMRKEQYDKAEAYLKYFPKRDSTRKLRQGQIYAQTDRITEAYKAYEELLFSSYQLVSAALWGIYTLTTKDGDMSKAAMLADKQSGLARLFEMGEYHEFSCRLYLAIAQKDADAVIDITGKLLASIDGLDDFSQSLLYEHMTFKETGKQFHAQVRERLLNAFREDEQFDFLREDTRWRELVG